MYLPASLVIPSRGASTQDALHIVQDNLSFPSLIQPALDAATASIEDGFVEYVESLYVERRDRKDAIEDGLYSTAMAELVALKSAAEARASSARWAAFSFLEAARDKMADK